MIWQKKTNIYVFILNFFYFNGGDENENLIPAIPQPFQMYIVTFQLCQIQSATDIHPTF